MLKTMRNLSVAAALGMMALSAPATAVPITVNYLDPANVGFNDPLLGQQRRAAFELTMFAFSFTLQGSVPITVDTYFLYDVDADWGYTEGWPTSLMRDFPGAQPGVYYPVSLANQMVNYNYSPDLSHVTVVFNGVMDIEGGIYGERFYYGLDGNAGNNVDFITEVAHSFMRGLGFYTLMDSRNGEYIVLTGDTAGYPDILTTKLAFVFDVFNIRLVDVPASWRLFALRCENYLRWIGPALTQAAGYYAPMYAPAIPAGENPPYGVADHFHPNYGAYQLMWPWYVRPCHDLSSARWALMDMGWNLN